MDSLLNSMEESTTTTTTTTIPTSSDTDRNEDDTNNVEKDKCEQQTQGNNENLSQSELTNSDDYRLEIPYFDNDNSDDDDDNDNDNDGYCQDATGSSAALLMQQQQQQQDNLLSPNSSELKAAGSAKRNRYYTTNNVSESSSLGLADMERETTMSGAFEQVQQGYPGWMSPSPSMASASSNFPDFRHANTSDILLRPPSNTSYHCNYPTQMTPLPMPVHEMQHLQRYGQEQSAHLHGYSPHMGGGGMQRHSQDSSNQMHRSFGMGLYPNMWYPNAPYNNSGGHMAAEHAGSSSSSSAGGSAGAYPYGGAYRPYNAPSAYHNNIPHPHHPHYQHHDNMIDMFQLSNSGREARNRAEKNRRDKLNGSIQELSTMVPHVAESPRRVDKTAVLRFAAHGLRLKYVFGKTLNQQRPQLTDTLMNMLDSFFLTLTCQGQILLISTSVEQHLGHCQADVYGQNILHITHPDDHNLLKQQLIPTNLENLFNKYTESCETDDPIQFNKAEEEYIDRKLREDRRSFRVRLARAGPRSEPTAYEVVKIDGCFRRSDEAPRGIKPSAFTSSLQLIRRTRGRDDPIPLHMFSGNDIVLTACARVVRPPKIINRLFDANTLEYKTRHLIDGRIIDCDQRIGIVAGYMTNEVRNLSPFTFMHNDDVRWVIVALRQMYDCNSSYGESTYRLFTRNGNIIYLQSKGYLEIDKDTNKVHSFVCVNTLLDDEEGKRRVQEMKRKFSVIINTKIPQPTDDVPASENPQQLEKAVLCLIQNLQKQQTSDDDEENNIDIDTANSMQIYQHSNYYQDHQEGQGTHSDCNVSNPRLAVTGYVEPKTPPLALIPPEAASVKSSISKSVSVANVTAAKHIRVIQQTSKPETLTSENYTCHAQRGMDDCASSNYYENQLAPEASTGLKRTSSTSDNDETAPAKRLLKETDIEHALSNSLDQIERKLNQQLSAAIELRDQTSKFDVPNTSQRIDEIMEEHQKQSELFVNIKSEYEVQMQNNAKQSSDPELPDILRPR